MVSAKWICTENFRLFDEREQKRGVIQTTKKKHSHKQSIVITMKWKKKKFAKLAQHT